MVKKTTIIQASANGTRFEAVATSLPAWFSIQDEVGAGGGICARPSLAPAMTEAAVAGTTAHLHLGLFSFPPWNFALLFFIFCWWGFLGFFGGFVFFLT